MEENVIAKTKSKKLEKRIASLRDDINSRRIRLRLLEKELEREKASEVRKMLEQSGMSLEEAKNILKSSHNGEKSGAENE